MNSPFCDFTDHATYVSEGESLGAWLTSVPILVYHLYVSRCGFGKEYHTAGNFHGSIFVNFTYGNRFAKIVLLENKDASSLCPYCEPQLLLWRAEEFFLGTLSTIQSDMECQ